jgi:serine/threonine-protein kinase
MADIYRARSTDELGVVREVVVKVVLPELAHSERLADLLISEAKLASRLDHPNVIRVENLGRADDDTLYIAMEWMDGLDLRDLLRRCARESVALPIDVSLFIVRQILRGLDYAHHAIVQGDDGEERRGIVHRDVSPSNVLISLDGEVKICDFGIARAHDEERDAAWSEAMVEGKAGYMSPEQASGEPLDPRADVFAAGIILWELLAGRRLYRAEGDEPLLAVAQRAEVADLPIRDLPFEDELHAIVGRALAKEREERFASAAEMAAAIEDYASRADLRGTARTLRRFVDQHFAGSVLGARRRRELATRAMAKGPLAVFEVLDVPVVGMVPPVPESYPLGPPSSIAPLSREEPSIMFSRSAIVLLAVSAILVAYLVFRAVQG